MSGKAFGVSHVLAFDVVKRFVALYLVLLYVVLSVNVILFGMRRQGDYFA